MSFVQTFYNYSIDSDNNESDFNKFDLSKFTIRYVRFEYPDKLLHSRFYTSISHYHSDWSCP